MSPHSGALPDEPDESAAASRPAANRPDALHSVALTVDLSSHELLRRAHVLAALASDWDPVAVLRGEEAAYELLYSGLSAEQQRVYDELVEAGVLPREGGGHVAA
ncbi:DUF6400 family protein [Streptomyces sp. LBL]|uniref:DUF6400 family protein n=1 Tax=Streptomyces sp. LBL TaxID=2940562 RepID=UPI002473544F|nr:DUF6400 family protein [Streptomyces sp. LBL]